MKTKGAAIVVKKKTQNDYTEYWKTKGHKNRTAHKEKNNGIVLWRIKWKPNSPFYFFEFPLTWGTKRLSLKTDSLEEAISRGKQIYRYEMDQLARQREPTFADVIKKVERIKAIRPSLGINPFNVAIADGKDIYKYVLEFLAKVPEPSLSDVIEQLTVFEVALEEKIKTPDSDGNLEPSENLTNIKKIKWMGKKSQLECLFKELKREELLPQKIAGIKGDYFQSFLLHFKNKNGQNFKLDQGKNIAYEKLKWIGKEPQLVSIFEELIKEEFLPKELGKKGGNRFVLIASHFIKENGEAFNNKQLSAASSKLKPHRSPLVDKIVKKLKSS